MTLRPTPRLKFGVRVACCLAATQVQLAVAADEGICSARTRYYARVADSPAALAAADTEVNAGLPFPRCPGGPTDARDLGELTILPSSSDGRSKRIVVELAVGIDGQDPTVCGQPSSEGNPRCYVARRHLAFVPHTALRVPTYFDLRCAGKTCDPASTCYRGACVDADAPCDGRDCLPRAERTGGVGFDPSATRPDAGPDAAPDGSIVADATTDAPFDGSVTDARPDATTDGAACTTGASAPALATSRTKCGALPGAPTACCVGSSTLASSTPAAGCTGDETERLCQTTCDCPAGADCVDVISSASGGYQGPRAACVQRGCANPGWGREGALGNSCANDGCCEATKNLRCDVATTSTCVSR